MALGTSVVGRMTISLSFFPVARTQSLSLAFAEPSTFVVNASGRVTYEETTDVLAQLLADPRLGPNIGILVDAREVTGAPATHELRLVARELRALHAAGVAGLAIVTSSTFVYGVARMFSVFAERSGIDVQVFRTMDEAERWLVAPSA
jgi:hypothetical protein